ncbi:MAG: tyrosine-type recombinase/integrase [Verrucomicrobiota bacterium]|nr:tyrosine-type recombinase/integrase [Verrucomicrobiota bacterium]
MAFVWKHPQSRYFVARFTDRNGKRRNRSTRTTNCREAQRIAEAFEAAANKRRTARQVREVIAALHKEITGDELPTHSFREFADSWLDRKAPEVGPSTLAFYRKAVSKFTAFLGPRADMDVSEITSDDVVAFRNHGAKTLAPKTVNHDLKALRMVFRAARRDKVITEDPSEFVNVTKKASPERRRPFTIPELKAILSVADEEWKSLVLFGMYTGQRLGDLASLTWQNVDLVREEIRLVTRKTGKTMSLPIAAPLRKHLESLPSSDAADAPLHPRAFALMRKQQGRTGHLSNQFAGLLADAGLREKQAHRKTHTSEGRGHGRAPGGLSFHCLRHTAVSLLKDAGIPAAVVMELVGHDSEQMSEHYTHVGKEALARAAASLPDLG